MKEEVVVEQLMDEMGPWYHDVDFYNGNFSTDKTMSRDEAEEFGVEPCPACFPGTEYAETYEVTQHETSDGDVLTFTKKITAKGTQKKS